ncbi:IS3 family transposase [Streptomyces sp. NPDC005708]|uniref:IS3 family transposase n=1 Tax=Streptomyces sp. NPDC005708 TaxID=3154564 RepID=UPI0034038358
MADPADVVGVISDQKTVHNVPHRTSRRALGVSERWFYKWCRWPLEPTKREARRAALAERIRYFFDRSGKTYGSPRVTLDLWEEGWQLSQNAVAEIMAGQRAAPAIRKAGPHNQRLYATRGLTRQSGLGLPGLFVCKDFASIVGRGLHGLLGHVGRADLRRVRSGAQVRVYKTGVNPITKVPCLRSACRRASVKDHCAALARHSQGTGAARPRRLQQQQPRGLRAW